MAAKKSTASNVSEWKKAPEAVELPSGKRMVVKRASLRTFLAKGVVPNSLVSIIHNSLQTGVSELSNEDVAKMMETPEQMQQVMELADAATVHCAVQPRVHPIPDDEDDRQDDVLYVDEIDDEDKMHIFNYAVGGTEDLATFRGEPAASVAPSPGS